MWNLWVEHSNMRYERNMLIHNRFMFALISLQPEGVRRHPDMLSSSTWAEEHDGMPRITRECRDRHEKSRRSAYQMSTFLPDSITETASTRAVRHVTRPESPPTRSYGPVEKIGRIRIPQKNPQKNILGIFGRGLVFARIDPNFLRRFSELSRNFPQKLITFLKTSENADNVCELLRTGTFSKNMEKCKLPMYVEFDHGFR